MSKLFLAVSDRHSLLKDFRPQELSNTAWAFAKVLPNWSIYPMPDIYTNELGTMHGQGFEEPSNVNNITSDSTPV